MASFRYRSHIEAPAEEVYAWHARSGAFERLVPPWADVHLKHFDGLEEGSRAILYLRVGPFRRKWVAEHRDVQPGRQFRDVQVRGPFRRWEHTHRMEPGRDGTSFLEDDITFTPPLGITAAATRIQRQLQRQFAYRHRVTAHDLALHAAHADRPRLRIAVSGASGFLGQRLVPFLTTGGHEVVRLVQQRTTSSEDDILWNPTDGVVNPEKLEGLDAVIHLAGENVLAMRWSEAKKMQIYSSRVRGTQLLSKALARLERPPRTFLSASGIGYYGNRGDELLTEASPAGEHGFLTAVCRDWEAATAPAAAAGIRTVPLRIGAVLSPEGGVLARLLPPFRFGLGGVYGDPGQYVSWIAMDDFLGGLYEALMNDAIDEPVNLVSPQPVTMSTLAQTLARVLSRPAWLSLPPRLLRLFFGEVANEALLLSTRARPARLEAHGYTFRYPELEAALRHMLGRTALEAHGPFPTARPVFTPSATLAS